MFNSKNLFKSVPCPAGSNCRLLNCIFSHDVESKEDLEPAGGDRKRQRLENGEKAVSKPSEPFTGRLATKPVRSGGSDAHRLLSKQTSPSPKEEKKELGKQKATIIDSKTKTISKPAIQESLNPRMLSNAPAPHNVRLALLRLTHEEMSRLNQLVMKSDEPADIKKKLIMSAGALINLALDEEEHIAKTQPKVYKSVMGHMVTRLKKTDVKAWIVQRKEKIEKEGIDTSGAGTGYQTQVISGPMPRPLPEAMITNLSPTQELHLLARYHIDVQSAGGGLENHGFVLNPPPESDIASTRRALRMADFWEACDRCGTRFQVFPNRREGDGALTTGGQCIFHWSKPWKEKGTKEALHQCCGQPVGSKGCTMHETHVFKTVDKRRMAGLWEFLHTPGNDNAEKVEKALSFDCEMAYTTNGMEIIRVSASRWPSGDAVLDVLVKPYGHVLDLNTRFSGVTSDQFLNAPKWTLSSPLLPTPNSPKLSILSDPEAARALFLEHVSPQTALLGHAMENDLNAIRIIHPTIVDTALIYPHPGGLPYRMALRRLAKDVLGISIQQQTVKVKEGQEGHDSLEDARATGWLVNAKVRSDWKKLKAGGWEMATRGDDASMTDSWFIPPDDTARKATEKAGRYTIVLKEWWM